jgi:hypothetical protein
MATPTNDAPVETAAKIAGPVLGAAVNDVFADGLAGIAVHAGTIRINLYSTLFDPASNNMVRMVTSRLVLPLNEFDSFRRALDGVASRLNEAVKAAAGSAE